MLRNAPPLLMPVPLSASDSAAVVMLLLSSSAAPEATVVPAAVVPSALACETRTTPALIAMAPEKVLFPERTSVPDPALVTACAPLMIPLAISVPPPAWRKVTPWLSVIGPENSLFPLVLLPPSEEAPPLALILIAFVFVTPPDEEDVPR